MNMEIKPVEPIEERKPTFQMTISNISCLDLFMLDSAWELIRKIEEEFAESSVGEYTAWDVYLSILYGGKHLFLAYLDPEGKVAPNQFRSYVFNCLGKKDVKNWIGFMVLEFGKTEIHIYQAYIVPEFQKTDAMSKGLDWLKDEARKRGAPALSFDTNRSGWERVAPQLGFKQTNTRFRISLKE